MISEVPSSHEIRLRWFRCWRWTNPEFSGISKIFIKNSVQRVNFRLNKYIHPAAFKFLQSPSDMTFHHSQPGLLLNTSACTYVIYTHIASICLCCFHFYNGFPSIYPHEKILHIIQSTSPLYFLYVWNNMKYSEIDGYCGVLYYD